MVSWRRARATLELLAVVADRVQLRRRPGRPRRASGGERGSPWAILLYLAEKSGRLLPTDLEKRSQVIQWLMFQMAGIGPMQGQAVVFVRYFPEDVPQVRKLYINEPRRLYEVLDSRLRERQWIVDDFSIADIANWSWIRSHLWAESQSKDSTTWSAGWSRCEPARPVSGEPTFRRRRARPNS